MTFRISTNACTPRSGDNVPKTESSRAFAGEKGIVHDGMLIDGAFQSDALTMPGELPDAM